MAVTSHEPAQSRQTRGGRGPDWGGIALGAMGSLISALTWIIGARYTVDGVLAIGNALLRFLTVPYQIPIPPFWVLYLLLSPLPLCFSLVEWREIPFWRDEHDAWQFAPFAQWVVWMVVFAIDGVTTFAGLGVDPGPEALAIMHQVAGSIPARVVVAAILTPGPEWLLRGMLAVFRRAFRRKH
jgi:hypothetical protein